MYFFFQFETGVHRVQRVPLTETMGRIHTSTMTVAVLAQPEEVRVSVAARQRQTERTLVVSYTLLLEAGLT